MIKRSWIRGLILSLLLLTPAMGDGGGLWGGGKAYAMIPVVDVTTNATRAKILAAEKANWLKYLGELGDILSGILALNDTVDKLLSKFMDAERLAMALDLGGQQALAKTIAKAGNALKDNNAKNVDIKMLGRIAADNASPRHEHLCKAILGHQLARTTEEFEHAVARQAATAIETMYRGANDDGSGPQYAKDNYDSRCKAKLGSPLDYPSDCVDTGTKGTDGRKLNDADLTFSTLTGGQVLEMPKMKSQSINGVTYSVPDPQNTAQKFWVAGLYYCYNLAGPRPTPPTGDAADSPEGATAKAQWNHCAAKQSALIKPCLELLAYHTRPNESDNKDLVKDQKEKCQAVESANVSIPESFGGCKEGLSPFQAQYLAQAMCKSDQYYIAQAMAGGKHPMMMDGNTDCSTSWNMWKDVVLKKQSKVMIGVPGILKLKKCWQGVGQ